MLLSVSRQALADLLNFGGKIQLIDFGPQKVDLFPEESWWSLKVQGALWAVLAQNLYLQS